MKQLKKLALVWVLATVGMLGSAPAQATFADAAYYLNQANYYQAASAYNTAAAGISQIFGSTDYTSLYNAYYYAWYAQDAAYYAFVNAPAGTWTEAEAYNAYVNLYHAQEIALDSYLGVADLVSSSWDWLYTIYLAQIDTGEALTYAAWWW
jgi:hypothetical protein